MLQASAGRIFALAFSAPRGPGRFAENEAVFSRAGDEEADAFPHGAMVKTRFIYRTGLKTKDVVVFHVIPLLTMIHFVLVSPCGPGAARTKKQFAWLAEFVARKKLKD
ncbi:hypothetical protein [Rugamonas sp.]|uniref:hypothetical protein n=1 Tax=Rugamonas sp. TaxID=1926287 RepID=UPI0025F0DE60|nr:hypothetical protein [Rugamonas sp.]